LSTPETIGEKRKKELDDLKLEIDKMKQAVDKAQIEYNQLDTDKAKKVFDTQMDFDMKDLQIQIAKKELDDLKSGDSDKIQEIKNAIKQKQKTIETIMKKYENYVLKANFDGVITKMTIQV
jgi:multidrug resistance efflux pump